MEPNSPACRVYVHRYRLGKGESQMASDDKKARTKRLSDPLKPAEPPAQVLLPDIYANNNWTPDLALEGQPPASNEAEGFNPYDTAVLYKK